MTRIFGYHRNNINPHAKNDYWLARASFEIYTKFAKLVRENKLGPKMVLGVYFYSDEVKPKFYL